MLVIPLVALASIGGPAATVRVAAATTDRATRPADGLSPAAEPAATDSAAADGSTPLTDAPQVTVLAASEAVAVSAVPGPSPRPTVAAASVVRTTAPPTTAARPAPTSPPTTRPAPTTTAAPAPQHSQSGPASYYDQAPSGTCAHPTLPFGTVVSIVDTDNGRTAKCTVEDRGPYAGGRIIDLAPDVFSQMAPTSQGVINVRISW